MPGDASRDYSRRVGSDWGAQSRRTNAAAAGPLPPSSRGLFGQGLNQLQGGMSMFRIPIALSTHWTLVDGRVLHCRGRRTGEPDRQRRADAKPAHCLATGVGGGELGLESILGHFPRYPKIYPSRTSALISIALEPTPCAWSLPYNGCICLTEGAIQNGAVPLRRDAYT